MFIYVIYVYSFMRYYLYMNYVLYIGILSIRKKEGKCAKCYLGKNLGRGYFSTFQLCYRLMFFLEKKLGKKQLRKNEQEVMRKGKPQNFEGEKWYSSWRRTQGQGRILYTIFFNEKNFFNESMCLC